jgi:hypothetical protein
MNEKNYFKYIHCIDKCTSKYIQYTQIVVETMMSVAI